MIGQTISHYKILEKLGEGGMGVVYKAHDTQLDRWVSLKFLPHYLSSDANEKERFYHEARAASSLNHPNITTIYEIAEHDGQLYIAMEFIEGSTLKKLLERDTLSIKSVLEIAIQACDGLSAAHEKGVVHRDIKSDNIMITPKGQVKIMDFGLAKVKGATKLTKAGSTVGTAAYMSPEQAQGEEVDHRSDIFSFGVVLYELLTGHLPFRGEHQAALTYSLINEDPQPIARFNDKISPDLERVVMKALEKDKGERYQHIDDMQADLRRERKNIEYAKAGYVKSAVISQQAAPIQKTPEKKLGRITVPAIILAALIVLLVIFNPFKLQVTKDQAEASANSLAVMYFENIPDPEDKDHTGEMLTNLLITALSQTKGLEVISRERLYDIQKELSPSGEKTLTAGTATKVAERVGVSTMLLGSILQKEPTLAITTRLIEVKSGKIISSQRVTGYSSKQVFSLVDTLTLLLRSDLSVSSAASSKSVAEVTTKSEEAYRAYIEGFELASRVYYKEARAAFERAIELDKDFAIAYYWLSGSQAALGDGAASQRSLEKAVDLADRTTERERLLILAAKYQQDDPKKAAETLEQLIERYPHETYPYLFLGFNVDTQLLEWEKGVQIIRRGLKVEPGAKILWNTQAYLLAALGRREEALESINEYIKLAPAEPNPYDSKGDIYAWFMDYDSSRAAYQKAMAFRRDFSTQKLGFLSLLRQQYKEAEDYFKIAGFEEPAIAEYRGRLRSVQTQLNDNANTHTIAIHLAYETGQYSEMLRMAKEFSLEAKKNPTNKVYLRVYVAWALAKNGKAAEARVLLDEVLKDLGNTYPRTRIAVEYASALVDFEDGATDLALDKFKMIFQKLPPNHEPFLVYGLCLLKSGRTSDAVAELERLSYWAPFSDLFLLPGVPMGQDYTLISSVKAHYWLGVAYEQQGEKQKAVAEYQKFLEIWKDADFKSHEIEDAKVRLAKLK